MESGRAPVPEGIDTDRPSAARVYDFLVRGPSKQNYVVDREFGRRIIKEFPLVVPLAIANRDWSRRIVREMLNAGITQFLDLGAGLPTAGAVHEIVAAYRDEHGEEQAAYRVVYVDNEGVAAAHARLILEKDQVTEWAGVVQQDLRFTTEIFDDPVTKRLIDWSKPVGLLAVAVFHFVGPADQPAEVIRTYRDKLAPGSLFALSHITTEEADPEPAARGKTVVDLYREKNQNPAWVRNKAEITSWFDGFERLPPGVVYLTDWRPDPDNPVREADQIRPLMLCGIGQKPDLQPDV
jgi:hypothetical protein